MSRGFFITGTDTDVGKTTVALSLMAAFRNKGLLVAGFKPVSAGCVQTVEGLRNDDAVRMMQQASVQLPYELVNPYAFAAPIAPHIAAAQLGIDMQIAPLVEAYQQIAAQVDVVIVEGAGGWLVPLNESQSMADVAKALGLPVILVVGIRLGCLNHALLTQDSIEAYGLKQAGWIANHLVARTPCDEENIKTLQLRLKGDFLGSIPYFESMPASSSADYLSVANLLTETV